MDAPESEAEALRLLAAAGYVGSFNLAGEHLVCSICSRPHEPARLVVQHTYRFEGNTDPGDEAIVLGLQCPDCGALGVVVSAYGPDADAELLAVLAHLAK